MPLTDEVLRRLAAIGLASDADLAYWRRLGDDPRASDATFLQRLREREFVGVQFRQRSSELHTFVDRFRRERPIPALTDLNLAERAQCGIPSSKMQAFVEPGQADGFLRSRRVNQVPLVTTTRTGLFAAQQAFGETTAVILTKADWDYFRANLKPFEGDGSFQPWVHHHWWLLGQEPPAESRCDPEAVRQTYKVPAEYALWFPAVGDRSVGERRESSSVYTWDGQTASFLHDLGCTMMQILEY